MSRRLIGAGLLAGVLFSGAAVTQTFAPALAQEESSGDTVTLTIGLLQDLSSPNVTVGYLVPDYELWNLQYASLTDKAADDFATIPGLAETVDRVERRPHLHLHAARGAPVVRRRAADGRRRRLHDQPIAR